MVENVYKDENEIYKNEEMVINFTHVMACNDPKFAANFLYRALKKERKEKYFPIFREKVAKLLEQDHYNYEATILRTINIGKK